ncbi:MAG: MaoC family dehydratase N-terminal domain-containing protein [Dactylosporangium sp.]|nr:MaoC family dehydratase N-terminal domain-containing protein [Dactylosporangium sp.]
MARWYEDFRVGEKFTSARRTVTEADVALFAGLSGDFNPLHTDDEFAKETPFGRRIAHGLLILSIVTGLNQRLGLFDGTTLAFLGLTWNFRAPVFPGDTIHFEMEITGMRETSKPDRGIVERSYRVLNQDGRVCQEGTMTVMLKRRPPGAEERGGLRPGRDASP